MKITILNTSSKPIYQQIFEQISSQIINGELREEYNLPSIRTAAKELRVSVITVKKAWEELERSGLIYTRAGKGCFVSRFKSGELSSKKTSLVKNQLLEDLKYYKELGLTYDELVEMIKNMY